MIDREEQPIGAEVHFPAQEYPRISSHKISDNKFA
jgi:hypothetical protein